MQQNEQKLNNMYCIIYNYCSIMIRCFLTCDQAISNGGGSRLCLIANWLDNFKIQLLSTEGRKYDQGALSYIRLLWVCAAVKGRVLKQFGLG